MVSVEIDVRQRVATGGPAKRLGAIVFLVALCFCAIFGKILLDTRDAAWERAAEVASGVVSTVTSDIARNIESYDLSLQAVIEGLAYPEIVSISPELRQRVLFDRSATAKHLHGILYIDEGGIVRLDSREAFPKPVSHADRDYFQYHRLQKDSGLHVSRPFVAESAQVISLSRRVSNPDGSFAGVVMGMVRLAYFTELFKDAVTSPNENVSLFRTDGTMLTRFPYDQSFVGRNMKHAGLFKHLPNAQSGRFESYAVADGIYRLFVYRTIGDLPLVASVGQATDDVYRAWRRYAAIVGLMVIVLCAISATFAFYLAREMRRRNEAERNLEKLASTDPLTGLFNRRDFNASLEREWRRAYRECSPLAILMIDADHFKSYNDRNGHQGGDKLLQIIGEAMLRSVRRGTDVPARFGGDEFTILLPGVTAQGAAQVAATVRRNLAELCRDFSMEGADLSIGLAALTPKQGQAPTALVAEADKALYRAKAMGRGRIEGAPDEKPQPARSAA
jgi:diguanylate cyclase (GGDEF)-like protein